MLVDVEPKEPGERWMEILRVISKGNPMPARIDGLRGCYLKHGFSAGVFFKGHVVNERPLFGDLTSDDPYERAGLMKRNWMNCYGVCDSPEQFIRKFGKRLEKDERRFVVSFTLIRKTEQSPQGGWRWHKWGPYIGKGKPTTEYLYDEPEVEEVYCYHIFEIGGECGLAKAED